MAVKCDWEQFKLSSGENQKKILGFAVRPSTVSGEEEDAAQDARPRKKQKQTLNSEPNESDTTADDVVAITASSSPMLLSNPSVPPEPDI
jgi:hypothetical protein